MIRRSCIFVACFAFISVSAHAWSLNAGQSLLPGQAIYSNDGAYRLILQSGDGNLVQKRVADSAPIWSAYTSGATSAKMQEDRNFVVYSNGMQLPPYALWSSNTYRNVWDANVKLEVKNNGSLYLKRDGFVIVWATQADPIRENQSEGYETWAICLRPGTSYQSNSTMQALNYKDAQEKLTHLVNDGAALFECH